MFKFTKEHIYYSEHITCECRLLVEHHSQCSGYRREVVWHICCIMESLQKYVPQRSETGITLPNGQASTVDTTVSPFSLVAIN